MPGLPPQATEQHDVVVLGGGAGGMTAAAVAAAEGLKVLLLEKSDYFGGTTAISGGMCWIPGNPKAAAIGKPDSVEAARTYLAQLIPGDYNMAVREAFLANAERAVAYLESRTSVRLQPVPVYPDYYPDLPGAAVGGRVLEPVPFDARALKAAFLLLRPPLPEFTLFDGMMIARPDIVHFRNIGKSLRSTARVAGLIARYGWQRAFHHRGTHLVLGNALAARLLHSLIRSNVAIRPNFAVENLLIEDGVVRGVRTATREIRASRGVVLATGGFSHNARWRAALLPSAAGPVSATNPADTGDGLDLACAIGASVDPRGTGGAFWTPVSCFTRADGSAGVFPHTVTDRAKPGAIAVNAAGRRFVNEAVSYHEFVRAMFRDTNAGETARAFLICDKAFLWRYGLGAIKPFTRSVQGWTARGYLTEAPDIRALAGRLGLDPDALATTVETFNRSARNGEDPEFGRGRDAYQRFMGDAQVSPNPCVRPIEAAPFYAITLYPGDLGTSSGLVTDASARVLDAGGAPIPGLYAAGNDMNSVMNGAYPGPGITLGPALTFGYLAGMGVAGKVG